MNKYALVVGVSTYDDPDISDLGCAAADAREIGKALREICGFSEVHELVTGGEREPLHVNIVDSLCSLAPTLTPDDMFLLYFAGHGIVTDSGTHLLTRNSRIQMPQLASLSWKTLSDCLSNISCADRVLIMDACRNDPHRGRGEEDNLMTERFSRDIMAIAETKVEEVTPATCVLFSCRTGERAYEWPEKGHGAFTHYLLEGLRGKALDAQGRITVGGLGRYAEERVPQWAKKTRKPLPQRPWGERKGSMREIVLFAKVISTPRVQTVDEPTPEVNVSERDEPGRIDWYYVHPEVKKEWVERCGETVTIQLAENGNRTEISPEKVIQGGIVNGLFYDKGEPVLKASIAALIAGGEMGLLSALIGNNEPNDGILRIAKLLIEGKKEKVRYELTKELSKGDASLALCAIMYYVLEDRDGLKAYFDSISETNEMDLFEQAIITKRFLNSKKDVMRFLKKAESAAEFTIDWMTCAGLWKALYSDDSSAMRCLKKAENSTEDSEDWCSCALARKKLFDDDVGAMRCLHKAEGNAEASRDWWYCAAKWKEIFNDDDESMRCLREAECRAEDGWDFVRCADLRVRQDGDTTKAARFLEKCEGQLVSSNGWIALAYGYKKTLSDDVKSRQCMRNAERAASKIVDLILCVKPWAQLFNLDTEAKKCLCRVERKAKDSFDWWICAEKWISIFSDKSEAIRCMNKAQKKAKYHFEWITIAEKWKLLLEKDDKAAQCLRKAESKAADSSELEKCAESWKKLFDDDGEATRCMSEAEKLNS